MLASPRPSQASLGWLQIASDQRVCLRRMRDSDRRLCCCFSGRQCLPTLGQWSTRTRTLIASIGSMRSARDVSRRTREPWFGVSQSKLPCGPANRIQRSERKSLVESTVEHNVLCLSQPKRIFPAHLSCQVHGRLVIGCVDTGRNVLSVNCRPLSRA